MTTQTPLNRSKKKRNTLLVIFILIVAVTTGTWYALQPAFQQSTDDAYVAGQQIIITSQEAGTVSTIKADNTQTVTKGSELLTLSRNKLALQQQAAQANLQTTVREVKSSYLKIEQLKAQIKAAKTKLTQAEQDYQRRMGGDKDGSVLPEALAHTKNMVSINQQNLNALNKQLQAAETQLPKEQLLDNPKIQAAIAQLRQVYLAQINTTIVAPKNGMIAQRAVQVGQHIQPGQPLMTIVPLDKVWIEANFKETQLRNMKPGQEVTVVSDIYGEEQPYTGVVAGIGAGTGSVFSAIPAQNATGNWIKIIQRVPVKIYIDPAQLADHPLRIGMSMNVTVNTGAVTNNRFDNSSFINDESLTSSDQLRLQKVDHDVDAFVQQITRT